MSRIVICPTRTLQKLVLRRVLARKTKYNYAVAFKDRNGWGISLAQADWLEPGQIYVND